jgi:hypothetical protein
MIVRMRGTISHSERQLTFIRSEEGHEFTARTPWIEGHHPPMKHDKVEFTPDGHSGRLLAIDVKIITDGEAA